jgi:hypothetical protein
MPGSKILFSHIEVLSKGRILILSLYNFKYWEGCPKFGYEDQLIVNWL